MNELTIFNYGVAEVRTVMIDGEPWFVAADVCRVLEFNEVHVAMRGLDEDEKDRYIIPTLGGAQDSWVISEAGLYSLILRSRKAEAKRFKRWVTHEVLPTIRKTGSYGRHPVQPQFHIPQTYAEALRLAADKEEEVQMLTQKKSRRMPRRLPMRKQLVSLRIH